MKIAILTSGVLPIPAVKGGAVENLIDFYLEYNEQHHLYDITVFSVWHPDVKNHCALMSNMNHYKYIRVDTFWAKIHKRLIHFFHKRKENYHCSVEYYFNWALKNIKKQHYNVIIIENRPAYALRLSQEADAILFCHLGNDFLNTTIRNYQSVYDSTRCFINASKFITKQVKTINDNDKKCYTVYNGIDVKKFFQAQPLNRGSLGLSNQDFIIVYSGRLVKEKGIFELIRAIKELNDIPYLKLLIIGGSAYGMDKNRTPFMTQLDQEIQSIKDRVVCTGFVKYDHIPSYLKMCDLAVVPSMWDEPFGLTVVEAMASGLPLVTTSSGGIPEICGDIATIVDRENIISNLANAIKELYYHPERRLSMAKFLQERSKLFDKEIFASNFFKVLRRELDLILT